MNEDESSACEVRPATYEDLDWIFQLEILTYSARHAVARQTLERWFGSNPNGFSIITQNGRRIGHLTFVPLRPTILRSFLQGTLLEQDIHAESLYTPEEKHLVRSLYVESIITGSNEHSALPIKALTCLAHDFVPLISRICDPINLESVYALAASGRGERLMKGLGFSLVRGGQERADLRSLYVARFSSLQVKILELYNRRRKKKERIQN